MLGIPVGTLGAVLAAYFFDTAEKEGGKGSSRASFANEEGIPSGMVIPGQLQGSWSLTILVNTRGIDICWVHQVINVFCC